jgi:Ca2+-binding EF-hand superfamily protein
VLLQQINQMIAEVDKDGSGTIDFDEFVHMMTDKMGERDARDELVKVFRIIDKDGNVYSSIRQTWSSRSRVVSDAWNKSYVFAG